MLTFFKGYMQCPAPSNVNLIDNINLLSTVELSWTENGTSTTWEIAIIPDFIVGMPLPSNALYTTTSNPYTIAGLSPISGCYAFFVRSVCSDTDVSSWIGIGSLSCTLNEFNYLATLSTNDFLFNNKVKIFPNPSSSILIIENFEKQIQKIEFLDLQGRIIKTINENKNEYQIDISNLQTATYIIKLSTEIGSETVRFIKN